VGTKCNKSDGGPQRKMGNPPNSFLNISAWGGRTGGGKQGGEEKATSKPARLGELRKKDKDLLPRVKPRQIEKGVEKGYQAKKIQQKCLTPGWDV